MPQQVLLLPAALEYSLYREKYDALAEDLEGEGVLVRVVPAVEEGGLSTGISTSAAEHYDLQIQVGSYAGAIVSTAKLVELVRHRLRGREGRAIAQRSAKIYLATGEEHEFSFGVAEN